MRLVFLAVGLVVFIATQGALPAPMLPRFDFHDLQERTGHAPTSGNTLEASLPPSDEDEDSTESDETITPPTPKPYKFKPPAGEEEIIDGITLPPPPTGRPPPLPIGGLSTFTNVRPQQDEKPKRKNPKKSKKLEQPEKKEAEHPVTDTREVLERDLIPKITPDAESSLQGLD
ncbi:hypothetical protein K439DRAFT_1634208 [Ramaria rubella]|nr:hypothetical protein K439DRAFT_1634208 [Ramaria rubella]